MREVKEGVPFCSVCEVPFMVTIGPKSTMGKNTGNEDLI